MITELGKEIDFLDYDGPLFIEAEEDEKGDFVADRGSRKPTHPGRILRDLYLPSVGVNITQLADAIGVSRRTVSMIVNESRPVTVDVANRLARALGTTCQFWLNLQNKYDSWEARDLHSEEYEKIPRLKVA